MGRLDGRLQPGATATEIVADGVDAVRLRMGDEAFDQLVMSLAMVVAHHRAVAELRDDLEPLGEAMDTYAPPGDEGEQ